MTNRIIRPSGLLIRDQRLLLLHYRYGANDRYNLPGGNLEPDEEIPACLMREFQEELNLTVCPESLLCVAETQTENKTTLHLVFQVACHGEPRLNSNAVRATEILWLSHEKLDTAPLYPAIGFALGPWLRAKIPPPLFLGRIQQTWFH
ncbi:MAG: NUDIX hydrolase [Magnetococcus sp. YQC-5]